MDGLFVFIRNLSKTTVLFLFFIIPIIFSYLPDLFGIHIFSHSRYSYEPVKVTWFLGLTALVTSYYIIYNILSKENKKDCFKLIVVLFSIITLFLISSIFSINPKIAFFGSIQKMHGFLFYLGLIGLFFSLKTIFLEHKKFNLWLIKTIFVGFIFIFIYSIIQNLNFDPLFTSYHTRVSLERVFSTLGNANYLAGYALILLPLSFVGFQKKWLQTLFLLMCLSVIIMTKSLFGIVFASLYLLLLLIKSKSGVKWIFIPSIIVIGCYIIFSFFVEYNSGNMKLYSFFARFYLWKTVYLAFIQNFKSFIIGSGFDTIYLVFNKFRDPMLSIYEDAKYVADSSHNIFIDILYSVGFIGFLSVFIPIFKILWDGKKSYFGHSIILFFLFFSFNIAVVSHYIILIFCLASIYSNSFSIEK